MNMPPPYSHSNYEEMVKELLSPYENAVNESMLQAAANVKSQATTVTPEQDVEVIEKDDNQTLVHEGLAKIYDCDVSVDSSLQRRCYAPLNCFVSAIERVIDVMTKYCRSCKYWESKDARIGNWLSTHKCPINHKESFRSMVTEGAVRIFNNSIEKNGLQYMNYIGDGDSSAFKKVHESNRYPGKPVEKLECVGHIQKELMRD